LSIRDKLEEWLIRLAMAGPVPARWFQQPADPSALAARSGMLSIEIVSHCWQYAHLLGYQLSSLVKHPPTRARVRMTVFHSPDDTQTVAMLGFFGAISLPGVEWSWQALPRGELFRRAIGRNRVARGTTADWVWYTDCDIVFHRDCLDTLAGELQDRRDPLVYPKQERVTAMLAETDPLLMAQRDRPRVVDIDPAQFRLMDNPPKAKGAYQIVHGDAARQCGYCEAIPLFQRPAPRWAKTHEDSAFRWLLGFDGVGLDLPGVYRIRHLRKGRYGDGKAAALVRGNIRRARAGIGNR